MYAAVVKMRTNPFRGRGLSKGMGVMQSNHILPLTIHPWFGMISSLQSVLDLYANWIKPLKVFVCFNL